MERLAHRPEHLAQSGGLRRGQPDRPHHVLLRQTEQLADRGRRAEHAGRPGDVPAGIVVRRIDRVAHARFGFEAENERQQEVAAGHVIRAGVCEQRRGHRRGRMDVVLRRGVVVVVHVRADAVHQRGVQRVEALRRGRARGQSGLPE